MQKNENRLFAWLICYLPLFILRRNCYFAENRTGRYAAYEWLKFVWLKYQHKREMSVK